MMKKTKLAALALCFALLVCALMGVACGTQTDTGDTGGKTEWSFNADLPVACEENEKVSIVLNVEGTTDYEVVYEVTFGGSSLEVSESGEFTPATAGTYTVKVKVTANGETKEKTYTLTVAKDATDPVITTKIADKTVEKGVYNFAGDIAEIVATDNKTQAENLVKSIVSVTLDGTALDITENACTFERAGEYNVSYKVTDEEGNSANASYKITVKGLYLNEKTFVSEVFQLAEYEIAEAKVYGIENSAIKVTLTQGDETKEVAVGDKVKFLKTSDVTLKYVLSVGEEEKETVEKTVKVTALDLMISAADFSTTEGDEITIPSASLSHETAGITISVKISGQYQQEQAVKQGDKITAASGVTDITYTAENEDKSFSLTRVISVVATGKDEIVSFEKINGENPDFNVPANGDRIKNEVLNDDPRYVHSGKYSAKLIFGENRPNQNHTGAGFLYWDNQVKTANVAGANGISMWIYSEKTAYIAAFIATGKTAGVDYSGAKASHVITLEQGWNEVTINFDYQLYNPGKFDINNGIADLFFHHVYSDADKVLATSGNTNPGIFDPSDLEIYIDEIRIRKLELPEGLYFVFENNPQATGAVGSSIDVVAPRMLDSDGVKVSVSLTDPNGAEKSVKIGSSFNLEVSGYYILTYKAEKEGKPSQEVSFQVLATDPSEFLSFEEVNGTTPDIVKGVYGKVTANTDSKYVKAGKQSAKLETVLNTWGNCNAGFAWDGAALQMPTVENANALTFWMYSEKELHLYATVTTGVSANNTWVCKTSKPIALSVGWNLVTLDVRYSFGTLGLDFNNGLQELYFATGDANGVSKTPATLYIDNVCFANSEIPDGLYFVFDNKPAASGSMGGTAVAVAPRMLVEDGVTLTVTVTAPNGEQTAINAGDSFDLANGGYYTLTYKAEKEGKPSQEESFQILVTVPGEFLSFEVVNGTTPDITKKPADFGEITVNTDSRYVKNGSQSAKLVTTLAWGNYSVGFCWPGGALQMPTVDGANGITFWMYTEEATHLYTYINTGAGSTWASVQAKTVALEAGWNFVAIDVRYDLVAANENFDLNNGLEQIFFRVGTETALAQEPATLYIDSVCFKNFSYDTEEFLSFELVDGATPDIAKGTFGEVTVNTDSQYVKKGSQSAKLVTVLAWGNYSAGFAWDGSALQKTKVDGANGITFWMYSETATYLYTYITTGVSDTWASVQAKPIALEAGWNHITIDVRYDLASTNEKFNLANGLQELFFRVGTESALAQESATLYIDNVCFAKFGDKA